MARFPQQRGLVSALAVGLAMATRVASFSHPYGWQVKLWVSAACNSSVMFYE
ncbi:unnamed protein product, partial [Ectocarpus sp. 13 AM-2016]